jgi:hypothetical protein
MAVIEGTARLKVASAEYDFAVDGGAIGTTTLRAVDMSGGAVPSGAVVTSGYVDVLTAVTSGGAATVAVSLESASDLLAPALQAALTTGRKSIIPAATGATSIKTTAARSLTVTIAVAALTAGKLRVVVFYT